MFQVNVPKHRADAISLGLPDERAIQAEEQPCSELCIRLLLCSSPATAIEKALLPQLHQGTEEVNKYWWTYILRGANNRVF